MGSEPSVPDREEKSDLSFSSFYIFLYNTNLKLTSIIPFYLSREMIRDPTHPVCSVSVTS